MQELDSVAWGVEGGVGRIRLCAPQRANTLAAATACALERAIDAVLAAGPRAVLLSAQGGVFCAGGDIDEFAAAGDRFDGLVDQLLARLHPAVLKLAAAPAPVVSAIGGAVGGAGVGLALCADFVLGADTMKLRTGYARLGLSPDLGSSHFLARRVGAQRAKQWFLLSDTIPAAQCLQYGVVDALYPPDALEDAAEALAARLAQGAPCALAAIKTLCDGAGQRGLQEQLDMEHCLLRDCTRTPDAREGVQAFLERRSPRFVGKLGRPV